MDNKRYKNNDTVTVVSLVKNGSLTFIDADSVVHIWEEFGEEIDLTFKDVKKMATRNKRFFSDCWVKIPDDVSKQLKIKNYLLDSKIDISRVDALFKLDPDKFSELLIGSSDGVQMLVVDAAVEKLRNEELDSMRILRIIKKVTGKDVETLAQIINDRESAREQK